MTPYRLTLKNFTGIASGQGTTEICIDLEREVPADAQIVAIVGPNGSGKTTIMDNLHPYRLMPSRASGTTPGSFSYYDHIAGGEASKELVWGHEGTRFQSLIRIRANGKSKKQEAYLFVVAGDGSTSPWSSPTTGLASDGKAENYDQCVEEVLGRPEVFFAAQFSAQGKTPIAKMTSTEIKKVIAQMLRMDDLANLSAKAADVFKGIRPHMAAAQEQALKIRQGLKSIDVLASSLAGAQRELSAEVDALHGVAEEITNLTVQKASLASALEQQVALRAQHEAVDEQIKAADMDGQNRIQELKARHAHESIELAQAVQDAASAVEVGEQLLESHRHRKTTAETLVRREAEVAKAERRLEELKLVRAQKQSMIEDHAHELTKIESIRAAVQQLTSEIARLTSDGEHMAAALKIAQQTAALMDEVPCRGTGFSDRCQLLAQARGASESVPVKVVALEDARKAYKARRENLSVNSNVLNSLIEVERQVRVVREELQEVDREVGVCREALAIRDSVNSAKEALPKIRSELTRASESLETSRQRLKEHTERKSTLEARHAVEMRELGNLVDQAKARLVSVKAGLPSLLASDAQDVVQSKLVDALNRQGRLREQVAEAERRRNAAKVELDLARKLLLDAQEHENRARDLAQEMSLWTLLSKGLGTDGVIAMSIDDAGPAVSALANALLEECYGGRFVLSIKTQEQTAAGLQKEAFYIKVEDTLRGESKLLDVTSGGEQVWINECVVRAFALYMAQACDVRHDTLFSDESDGPLDPQRKRQYMQMRRTVLEKGGYSREYIITQTPELLEMCDAVIDLSRR